MTSVFFEDIAPINIPEVYFSNKISYIIENEGFIEGNIVLVFCSDNYLLDLNIKHLNHNYFTDIITFPYLHDENLTGDLFISIDRVKANAIKEDVSFDIELERVIYHGVLHLCGYNDKTEQEINEMRFKENFYLQ